nr:DUF2795 domain-containing protein [Microbacterium bovistercoris]
MHISESLSRFLAEMEYPATKDDLLREGIRADLRRPDCERLESLPEISYHSAWSVRRELGALRLIRAAEGVLSGGALHESVT